MYFATAFAIAAVLAFGPDNVIASRRMCILTLAEKTQNPEKPNFLEDTYQEVEAPAAAMLSYGGHEIHFELDKNCWPRLRHGSAVPPGYSAHIYSEGSDKYPPTSAVIEGTHVQKLPGFNPKGNVRFYEKLIGLS
ncbi:hypothetical protein MGG_16939 [Pyricularia oryzae 70-15]|uniref:Uncharacterized protein n=2 Tax=Pyricularia oryzae TaxID=318829 RepID=G4N1H0_PYRO7|nr:uncharacterized protein MGG_16939 [Pyricularia oryzae 70-15]EHA53237.1 hypothetical protein MGG_16939 [Pyricularia oryzae 70-15]ELQ32367.1 hypothetical protein OOU_Y34scaffold01176g2 [Pyricularia oryzae Y34]KAI7908793.1 hypothetical protein M9X92_011995 [Pyricularia oryzae]KAI7909281.1 hypothetical protein M0657_011915 [Pyricularia oryzae]